MANRQRAVKSEPMPHQRDDYQRTHENLGSKKYQWWRTFQNLPSVQLDLSISGEYLAFTLLFCMTCFFVLLKLIPTLKSDFAILAFVFVGQVQFPIMSLLCAEGSEPSTLASVAAEWLSVSIWCDARRLLIFRCH